MWVNEGPSEDVGMTQASAMSCTPSIFANRFYIMNTIKHLPRHLHSLLLTALLALSLGAMAQGQGQGRNKQQAAEPPAAAASQAASTASAKGVPAAITLPVKAYLTEAQRKIIQDHTLASSNAQAVAHPVWRKRTMAACRPAKPRNGPWASRCPPTRRVSRCPKQC